MIIRHLMILMLDALINSRVYPSPEEDFFFSYKQDFIAQSSRKDYKSALALHVSFKPLIRLRCILKYTGMLISILNVKMWQRCHTLCILKHILFTFYLKLR